MKKERSLTNSNKYQEVNLDLFSFYRSCADLPDGPLTDWEGDGTCFSFCNGKLFRWIPSTTLGSGYIDYAKISENHFMVVVNVTMCETTPAIEAASSWFRIGIKISGNAPILNTDEDNLIFVGGARGGNIKSVLPQNKETQYIAHILPLSKHKHLLNLFTDNICNELNEALVELQDNQFFFSIHRATTNSRRCAREIVGAEYNENDRYNYYIVKAHELLFHIEESLGREARTKKLPYRLTNSDRRTLTEIHNTVLTQFEKNVSLSLLAQEARMSVNRFSLLYKYLYGETVYESMFNARMAKARELLTQTRLSVKEISAKIGYKEPSGFSRAYFKHYGHLPSKNRDL